MGRAVIDGRTIQVRDLAQAIAEYPETTAAGFGVQSTLAVPLMRAGAAIGVIRVSRTETRPFTDTQTALLQTFADQAIIAIENVRLFNELEARNRDLTQSLDRQTATADILRAISQAQTDRSRCSRPSWTAPCGCSGRGGHRVSIRRRADQPCGGARRLRRAAAMLSGSGTSDPVHPPMPPSCPCHRSAVHHVVDVETDPSCSAEFRAAPRERGFRSFVPVPMLRGDDPLGVIAVGRARPGPSPQPRSRCSRPSPTRR